MKKQSAESGIFQSVEQSAMYDIYKEQSEIAKEQIEYANKQREMEFVKFKKFMQENGYYPYSISQHYKIMYWYYRISHYINDKFIGVESLATPESRRLNRELGLHKVNK